MTIKSYKPGQVLIIPIKVALSLPRNVCFISVDATTKKTNQTTYSNAKYLLASKIY
jgi:hypothetical protein